WEGGHTRYLKQAVYLKQTRGIPKNLDPARADRCPETFRHDHVFRAFGNAYKKLRLIRVVKAEFVARMASIALAELLDVARRAIEDPTANEATETIESTLALWGERCALRPVWTSFLEDHTDLFAARPADDTSGWADELRDRLGLCHHVPRVDGDALPILVFVYPVSAVPNRKGLRAKPLATPTVLDGDLSPAFCPAPDGEPVGRVVHLGASEREPVREIVHPFFVPAAKHLFRVGEITRPPLAELGAARARHLEHLRTLRADYAETTDLDLLAART
ncbi:MAG: hypothetical protein AAGD38_01625, partial [Acidobacteriota bacterium]